MLLSSKILEYVASAEPNLLLEGCQVTNTVSPRCVSFLSSLAKNMKVLQGLLSQHHFISMGLIGHLKAEHLNGFYDMGWLQRMAILVNVDAAGSVPPVAKPTLPPL